MVTCDQCGGEGWVRLEEDGRDIRHDCYRCCATGLIPLAAAHAGLREAVAAELAEVAVMRRVQDDEEFDLCAAERGFTPWGFRRALVFDLTDKYMRGRG